jgi:hypothetical protein
MLRRWIAKSHRHSNVKNGVGEDENGGWNNSLKIITMKLR